MNKITAASFLLGIISLFLFVGVAPAFAYQIEDLPGLKVWGDFTVGPGKTELFLDPGQTVTRTITITNRTGEIINFSATVEDFKGTETGELPVVLMGDAKSPYSLKDYLKPETNTFTLNHGQKITLPVTIEVPADAEPGGLYGAVLISALPPVLGQSAGEDEVAGGVRIMGRVGCLFFVRVSGLVNENGELKAIRTLENKKFYTQGPFTFELLYQNNGSVHLNPYGVIQIKNIFGQQIDEIEQLPWFVMPQSLRINKVEWDKKFLFGYYVATAEINRGYGDIIDSKSCSFLVLPWKVILPAIITIIILVALFWFFVSKFEIRTKSRP